MRERRPSATAEPSVPPLVNYEGTDAASIVNDIGRELASRLINGNLRIGIDGHLPPVSCPERDFLRIMEILLTRALTPTNGEKDVRVKVGATVRERVVVFSIRSSIKDTFKPGTNRRPSRFRAAGRVDLMAEARELARRNWIWTDVEKDSGSAIYLMVPRAGA